MQGDGTMTAPRDNLRSMAQEGGFAWQRGIGWGAVLLLLLVIGGSNERFFFGRGLAEVVGALLLGAAIAGGRMSLAKDRLLCWALAALALLLAIQVVPLPPSLWQALPGRELVVSLDRALAIDRWRPLTLDLEAAFAAFLFLVPCIGALLCGTSEDPERRRWLLRGVAAAWAIGVGLSFMQATFGMDLRYNQTAHDVFVTGFFFNHNHHAAFLSCSGLMVAAMSVGRRGGYAPLAAIILATGLAVLLTASRSGVVLFVFAVVSGAALLRAGDERSVSRFLWLFAIMAVAGLAALAAFSDGPLAALAGREALSEDRRYSIWARSFEVLRMYWPAGSGLGTFAQVYAAHEPLAELRRLFVNHAHNDLLEFVIETGFPGIAVLTMFGAWLAIRSVSILLNPRHVSPVACAAITVLWLLLFASLVEFPLRTVSLAALASLCIGLVAREVSSRK